MDIPKELQIACGLYPIAQLREPYSSVGFIHKRIPLDKVYDLKFPYDLDDDESKEYEKDHKWTAYELCEAYADFRGYRTQKGGKLDSHRGGKEILKEVANGVIRLYFEPPDAEKEEMLEKEGKRENLLDAAREAQKFLETLGQRKTKKVESEEEEEGEEEQSEEEEQSNEENNSEQEQFKEEEQEIKRNKGRRHHGDKKGKKGECIHTKEDSD